MEKKLSKICSIIETLVTFSSQIGLTIASVVMRYQMSLLDWETRLIADDMDLYNRMENDCQVDLKTHEINIKKSEQIQQLTREKESLILDIDIIKQLKVG